MLRWRIISNILILQQLLNFEHGDQVSGSILMDLSDDEVMDIYRQLCDDWASFRTLVDRITGELY